MKRRNIVLFLALLLPLAELQQLPVLAGILNSEIKISGSDTALDDFFGISVATNGKKALVGAYRDKDAGIYSGSAYIFDATTGEELVKLTASDAGLGHQFGYSLDIGENIAIIGAPTGNNNNGVSTGAAYLFDVIAGEELIKLLASDGAAYEQFGYSVSISGNTTIVGAPVADAPGFESGAAYLFDVTTGEQLFKLTASDASSQDNFGSSVVIEGNIAAISGAGASKGVEGSGTVYLFDVTTGVEIARLTAPDPTVQDGFGSALDISGNIIIIGSNSDDVAGRDAGAAYLFDATTGQQLFKLTAHDAAEYDLFGSSVAISGNIAIVGAFAANAAGTWSGATYLFDVATGQELLKLTPSDASERDFFGGSVAISGNAVVIGAKDDDNAGKAYIFRNTFVPEPSSLLLTLFGMSLLSLRGNCGCFIRRTFCGEYL